ncbi:MAG: quinoprotein relay system zinc metallohydrolase 1 [Hyphomicrobium sp.]
MAAATSAAAAPFLPAFVAEADPLAYKLDPIAVSDGVWMIAGAPEAVTIENGGAIANSVILDSSGGAIVVDTGPSKRYGDALAAIAKTLTGKPVVRVYITHFHPDHAFGNQAFDAKTIAAPEGVIKGLAQHGAAFSDAMYYIARDWMRGTEIVLPTQTISEGVESIGARRFRLMPLAGHTSSDLAIFDETSGILMTGDLAFLNRAPTTPHADLAIWRKSLTALDGIGSSKLVPGHGPAVTDKAALAQTRLWLDEIERIISACFERGLDMTEAMAIELPASISDIALARYEFSRSVMHFYPKLEAARLPRVGGRAN